MYAKLEITGTIEVVTGLHIGASSAFAAIGSVDSPIIRDPFSDLPIIPGSSLKGKIRALLAKKYNENKNNEDPNDDDPILLRLFGNSKKAESQRSRLIFRDLIMSNIEELKGYGINSATEVKFENSISCLTAVANPRQIERVIRGAKFPLTIIYDVVNPAEVKEDISLLAEGIVLLECDYLGGNGSR
ncbi:MAG: type III-A CRISPR-associated RAMP protein Csm3, partial [Clostridiales bacterium]|nr:type III-A CRISPR-associated RAMP protein Csm3 [Clostridiales bacterium]